MKKILIAALFGFASMSAFADTGNPCTGGDASNATVADADSDFAVTAINFRCSQNVFLSYEDSATVMAVGAGSKKGKTAYKGNSSGGAITKNADCVASGCTQQNAIDAATQGLADASS